MHKHNFGLLAEYAVMFRYLLRGYIPIKHRWKTKYGEIDIIFKRGNSVIFCEVKARTSEFDLEKLVTQTQQRRINRACEYFLSINEKLNIKEARIDLALVKNFFNIKIFENWQEG